MCPMCLYHYIRSSGGIVGSSRKSVHLDNNVYFWFIQILDIIHTSCSTRDFILLDHLDFISSLHLDLYSYFWIIQTSYLHLIQIYFHASGSSRLLSYFWIIQTSYPQLIQSQLDDSSGCSRVLTNIRIKQNYEVQINQKFEVQINQKFKVWINQKFGLQMNQNRSLNSRC